MSELDKIVKLLENHEKRILNLEKIFKTKPVKVPIDDEDVISKLIGSGFFDEPKKYSEIIKKLKTQAKFNKKTNYVNILKKLTKETKLERKMVEHQWRYVKNV